MSKHRAVIVGAGRIGAAYQWPDDKYSHAGAYMALKDRVDLVGFVEPDRARADAASAKWNLPCFKSLPLSECEVDIVSICTRDADHMDTFMDVFARLGRELKGVWMEKPFPWSRPIGNSPVIQVNYQRRADRRHRNFCKNWVDVPRKLIVYGKDDETTRCHFRDLSRFWKVPLDYRPFNGPCAYVLETTTSNAYWFDNGGVDSAECFKGMLGNLLDAVEGKAELWSPPYVENT